MEILLALALSVLLMAALYGGLELYRQYTTAGREEVERAQLARAILRTIERDIRSVVFTRSEDIVNLQRIPAADELVIEVIDPAEAYYASSMGVMGDAQTLVLHVSRPSRSLDYSALLDAGSTGRTSDLQSVSYFLAVAGGAGLHGAVGNQATGGRAGESTGVQGLSRLAGDRLAMDLADAVGDVNSLAEGAELLAPEVTFLQFRYFDGLIWLDVWDTVARDRLPQAIEIVLGLRSSAPPREGRYADDRAEAVEDTYRLVVALPLAEPTALGGGW